MSSVRKLFKRARRNDKSAIHELQARMESGDAEARHALASCYYNGFGVRKNQELARHLFHLHQSHILYKMKLYSQQRKRDHQLIDDLDDGHCAGFTLLALYAAWLQQQPIRYKVNAEPIPRDDLNWFNAVCTTIINWDGKSKFTAADEENIERLLGHIIYYQSMSLYFSQQQGEFQHLFSDTKNRILNKEYTLAASFTIHELENILRQLADNNKMVILLSSDHYVGFIKLDDTIHYINSSATTGLQQVDNFSDLAAKIFQACDYKNKHPAPFAITIFGIKSPENAQTQIPANYPPQEELLRDLQIFKPEQHYLHAAKTCTPLHRASYIGCERSVKFMLQHFQNNDFFLDCRNEFGLSALSLAACNGQAHIVSMLVEAGAYTDLLDVTDWPALAHAAARGHLNIVQYLIGKGASGIDIALLAAAREGHLEVVNYLIQQGADVNHVARDQATPLTLAAKNGHMHVVAALLANGADHKLADAKKLTAKDYAAKEGYHHILKVIALHRLDVYDAKLAARKEEYQPRFKMFENFNVGYSKTKKQALSRELRDAIVNDRPIDPACRFALRNHELGEIADILRDDVVLRKRFGL